LITVVIGGCEQIAENSNQLITVTSPLGGEKWIAGNSYTVTWTSERITGNVQIRLDYPGSSNIIGNVDIANGQYTFTIPSNFPARNDWAVAITAFGVTPSGGDIYDWSEKISIDEGIAQSITVTNPVGGETWEKGKSYTIKWTSTGITGNVQIRLDYPGSSNTIGTTDISTGQFTYTIPSNFPSRNDWAAAITAFGVTPSGGDIYDWSEKISISEAVVQTITVTNPVGGETWIKGRSYTIKWTSTGITGNVQIRLDYPGSSNSIGTVDISTGQFTYTIPSNFPSRNDWAVAITAFEVTPSGGDIYDWSEKISISEGTTQSITVTNPVGGETWNKGQSYTIKWTSTGITGNVQIRLDYPGSSNIVGNFDITDGQYTFTIPSNFPSRNDWAVAITAFGVTPTGGDIYDWSNSFTIQ
jgi:hypothetical protein